MKTVNELEALGKISKTFQSPKGRESANDLGFVIVVLLASVGGVQGQTKRLLPAEACPRLG